MHCKFQISILLFVVFLSFGCVGKSLNENKRLDARMYSKNDIFNAILKIDVAKNDRLQIYTDFTFHSLFQGKLKTPKLISFPKKVSDKVISLLENEEYLYFDNTGIDLLHSLNSTYLDVKFNQIAKNIIAKKYIESSKSDVPIGVFEMYILTLDLKKDLDSYLSLISLIKDPMAKSIAKCGLLYFATNPIRSTSNWEIKKFLFNEHSFAGDRYTQLIDAMILAKLNLFQPYLEIDHRYDFKSDDDQFKDHFYIKYFLDFNILVNGDI